MGILARNGLIVLKKAINLEGRVLLEQVLLSQNLEVVLHPQNLQWVAVLVDKAVFAPLVAVVATLEVPFVLVLMVVPRVLG